MKFIEKHQNEILITLAAIVAIAAQFGFFSFATPYATKSELNELKLLVETLINDQECLDDYVDNLEGKIPVRPDTDGGRFVHHCRCGMITTFDLEGLK